MEVNYDIDYDGYIRSMVDTDNLFVWVMAEATPDEIHMAFCSGPYYYDLLTGDRCGNPL